MGMEFSMAEIPLLRIPMKNKKFFISFALILVASIIYLWYDYQKSKKELDKGIGIFANWLYDIGVAQRSPKSTPLSENILKEKIPSNHIFVAFEDLHGLRTGDKVRYKGELVGYAEIFSVTSEDEDRYTILIKFEDPNLKILKNSEFFINTLGSHNIKYIEIIPPKDEKEYLEKGSFVKGRVTITLPPTPSPE